MKKKKEIYLAKRKEKMYKKKDNMEEEDGKESESESEDSDYNEYMDGIPTFACFHLIPFSEDEE